MLLRYWLFSLKDYNEAKKDAKDIGFNEKKWFNKECDVHFQRKIDSGEIKPLIVKKAEKKKQWYRKENIIRSLFLFLFQQLAS